MTGYGQFCSFARAVDLLGGRWSLLIVRELLSGGTRFNDIRRGIPRVSRTMLSARLRELVDAGVVAHAKDEGAYALTPAGQELAATVAALGTWGQRWLPRTTPREELDANALVWDMRRRVRTDALPPAPIVARIELSGGGSGTRPRFLLLRREEVSLCGENPGFPEELIVGGPLRTVTAWWRGDLSLADARSQGMIVRGRPQWVRAFPTWFERYLFAGVAPAHPG